MLSIVKGPYLQWPTLDSVTVMWETSVEAAAEVSVWDTQPVHSGLNGRARTLEETERRVTADRPGLIHKVILTGLSPDTSYHYRARSSAGSEEAASGLFPLKTAVAYETPFAFAVTSETGGYGDEGIDRRLFARIARYRPEFLLLVGDAVRRGNDYEDWDRFLFAPGRELFAHTPFYLCPGNHEEDASWLYRFTASPAPQYCYSFDYGNAHFTGLDSTRGLSYRDGNPVPTGAADGCAPGAAQYEFLKEDLRASRAVWKIVFFHYPPYVSGDYEVEAMRGLCPVLEEGGADLVFNSHTIVYERSHPIRAGRLDGQKGIIYVVAGGAGACPEWFHPRRAWHTAQALAVPHFVQVAIAGPRLELNAIDEEGRLFDTLILHKPG
ncbi:MAG: metallophosphoesterase family protein [Armatimonadetes bacterium]|nr:metallophosphoesterase family protein [Armatimonadota bacterium]